MADTRNLKILIRGTERAGVWYEPQMSAVQDVSTNQSTITITHKISVDSAFGSAYQPYNPTSTYVKIDSGTDTAYALTSYPSISAGSSATVLTTIHTVSHGSDGTKTVTIAFRYNPGGSYTGSGSTTWTLSTIPRASGLTVPNFTMGVAGTITIDRKSSSFTHTLTWSIGSGSGTITVPASGNVTWTPPVTMIAYTPNATSGTITFTLKTFSGSTQIGSVSKSSTLTCPARSTFSCGDFKMATNSTITINRSAAYTHTLTWTFGSGSGSITVPASGNVSWTPSASMMNYIPNALSGSITLTLTSKNGTATVGSYSLTKTLSVPSASSMSSGNFTMGTAGNITITRYAAEFSHTLTWKFGNKSGSLTVGSGATVSWTPVLADLCGQIPNAMSGTVTFTLTTKHGTATVGTTSMSKTLSLPNYTPSVSLSVSPSNSNATVRGWGVYVKGYTAVSYSSSVSGLNGASVASYTVTFGGAGTKTTASGTSAVLNSKGSVAVKMTVTDSRGKSKSVTQNVTYYDYGLPGYSGQSAFRCNSAGTKDALGTYLSKKITAVNTYSCGGNNVLTCKWRYKTANGGTWSAYSNIASGTADVSSGLQVALSYVCELVVTDSLGSHSEITITIQTDKVPFNIKDGGKAAAFFGYAQTDNTLTVYGTRMQVEAGNAGQSSVRNSSLYGVELYVSSSNTMGLKSITPDSGYTGEWLFYTTDEDTSVVTIPKGLIIGGNSTPIGSFLNKAETLTSVSNEQWVRSTGCLTLPKGSWVIKACANFPLNATGQRILQLTPSTSSSSSVYNVVSANAVSTTYTRLLCERFVSQTESKNWYIFVYQTSGSVMPSVGVHWEAVRIA